MAIDCDALKVEEGRQPETVSCLNLNSLLVHADCFATMDCGNVDKPEVFILDNCTATLCEAQVSRLK